MLGTPIWPNMRVPGPRLKNPSAIPVLLTWKPIVGIHLPLQLHCFQIGTPCRTILRTTGNNNNNYMYIYFKFKLKTFLFTNVCYRQLGILYYIHVIVMLWFKIFQIITSKKRCKTTLIVALLGWAHGMQIFLNVYIGNLHSIHDKLHCAVKLTVLLLYFNP